MLFSYTYNKRMEEWSWTVQNASNEIIHPKRPKTNERNDKGTEGLVEFYSRTMDVEWSL